MDFDNYEDINYIKSSYVIDFLEGTRGNILDEIILEDLNTYIYFCSREDITYGNIHFIEIDFFNDTIYFEWYGDHSDFKPWVIKSTEVEDQLTLLEEFLNFAEIITDTKGGSIKREDFIKKYDLR